MSLCIVICAFAKHRTDIYIPFRFMIHSELTFVHGERKGYIHLCFSGRISATFILGLICPTAECLRSPLPHPLWLFSIWLFHCGTKLLTTLWKLHWLHWLSLVLPFPATPPPPAATKALCSFFTHVATFCSFVDIRVTL